MPVNLRKDFFMKTYQIHLIRNGLTQGNLDGAYIGRTDEPLCPEGVAGILDLKEKYGYPLADHVFTSPQKRCIETARLIYPDFPTAVIQQLRECDFGDFEGKTPDELKIDPAYKAWLSGSADVCPPGGESNRAFATRVLGGFCRVVDGMISSGIQKTAIVTHGGAIMAILAAYGVPQLPMSEWLTPAGCGYTVLITPGLWASHKKLEVYCDVPELPMSDEEQAQFWDWYPPQTGDDPLPS